MTGEAKEAATAEDPALDAGELLEHLIIGGPSIILAISDLVGDISKKDFFGIGQNAGKIIALIISNDMMSSFLGDLADVADFCTKNFDKLKADMVPDIKEGVHEVEKVANEYVGPVVDGVEDTVSAMYGMLFEPDQRGAIEKEAKEEA